LSVLLFGSICQHFTLERATCFTCVFVVKNNAVQHRSNIKWCRSLPPQLLSQFR